MTVLLLADDEQRNEWLSCPVSNAVELTWITKPEDLLLTKKFDACIDLLFENTGERIRRLNKLNTNLMVVNSVVVPLRDIAQNFVRINGWATFLKRAVVEAAAASSLQSKAKELFSLFGRMTEWVPDIEGFVTPRIVASIINEAFFTLEEKVSTEEEIDIAMKLGTNYPYGPFEWGKKIGLQKVYFLLNELSRQHNRYQPSTLLTQTALA
jgi:3-hydroxybutyryl-CoA dehydrogenase